MHYVQLSVFLPPLFFFFLKRIEESRDMYVSAFKHAAVMTLVEMLSRSSIVY